MTKLEGSGRQKWKKAMTKTDGKRLRVRVAWERQKLSRRIGGIEGLDTWLQSVLVGTLYTSAEGRGGGGGGGGGGIYYITYTGSRI